MDAFLGNLVTSNPWEVALSHDGRQVYIVFSGTNDLFACRELDDNYREIEFRKHLQLGHNPRAVRVSPDNKTVYVYNALDFNVVAYDTEKLEVVATIPVCENPLGRTDFGGQSAVLLSAPADGRETLDFLFQLPSRRRRGRSYLAQSRRAAQYAVLRRDGLDAPDPLVG